MRKLSKFLFGLLLLVLFSSVGSIRTEAAVDKYNKFKRTAVTVKVTTYVENDKGGTYSYDILRAARLSQFYFNTSTNSGVDWYGSSACRFPFDRQMSSWNFTNGQTQNFNFRERTLHKFQGYTLNSKPLDVNGQMVDLLYFQSGDNTGKSLSLQRVEIKRGNAQRFYYTDDGNAGKFIYPFNWVDLEKATGTVEIVLYFKNNPDINDIEVKEVPKPELSKEIDWLGDHVKNPDTPNSGPNDYRAYVTFTSAEAMEKQKSKDIIFLMDTSGSMYGTRMERMKKVVGDNVQKFLRVPGNRVSVIKFSTKSETIIANSTNAKEIKDIIASDIKVDVNNGSNRATNYYGAFIATENQVKSVIDPTRETVVFFLTDGYPTAAAPGANATGADYHMPVALAYACHQAELFPQTDKFYSIFMGDNPKETSALQTVTDKIRVKEGGEKYTVMANDDELEKVFKRFIAQLDDSMLDVEVHDTISEYVDFKGNPRAYVTSEGGDGRRKELEYNKDYTYEKSGNSIVFKLKVGTEYNSKYEFSYDLKANKNAWNTFEERGSTYPDSGDEETDYKDNTTSSGKEGFYSDDSKAILKFNQGGAEKEMIYNRPVVQVKEPDAVPIVINTGKILEGAKLQAGQFEFILYDSANNELERARNDGNGQISFTGQTVKKAGEYKYYIKEVIPGNASDKMEYDKKQINVLVTVVDKEDTFDYNIALSSDDPKASHRKVFYNVYKPEPVKVDLEARKVLEGAELSGGQFSFALYNAGGQKIAEATNDAYGYVEFKDIQIEKAGKHTFSMREIIPVAGTAGYDPNIIYDSMRTEYVDVDVEDDDGELEVEKITYRGEGREAVFTNYYRNLEAKEIKMKVVLTHMKLQPDMFKFQVLDEDEDEKLTLYSGRYSDKVEEFGFNVDEIEEDIEEGTYVYYVRQLPPDKMDRTLVENMKLDMIDDEEDEGRVIKVEVEVEEIKDGEFKFSTEFKEVSRGSDGKYKEEGESEGIFYNQYSIRGLTY